METKNTVPPPINLSSKETVGFPRKKIISTPLICILYLSDSCTYSVHKRTNHKNNISAYVHTFDLDTVYLEF